MLRIMVHLRMYKLFLCNLSKYGSSILFDKLHGLTTEQAKNKMIKQLYKDFYNKYGVSAYK